MRNKLLFLSLLIILFIVGTVSATNTTSLISPSDTTIVNNPVTFSFNISNTATTGSCVLYTDENGSWAARETDSGVINATTTSFSARTLNEVTGASYKWNVLCGNSDWAAANFTFGVDDTNPSIIVNEPTDKYWDTDGKINITITVTDDNPNTCVLTSTMNYTNNISQTDITYSAQSYTNATTFNFTGFDGFVNKFGDNNTGAYTWSVNCTDDAGNEELVATRTIYVDTTAPAAFTFNTSLWQTDNVPLWNATTATDYTPQIGWKATVESNFSRYRIRFSKDTVDNATFVEKNVTTISTLFTNMATLVADTTYFILITAYDLAGNARNMTVLDYKYSTTSTGHSLPAGWAAIMNSGNARNLSDYLEFTGATTVSYFNSTHEFTSHVSGGTGGAIEVPSGESVFIYMASAATYSDEVWNTTAVTSISNLTNQTNSDWNVVCNRNGSQTTVSLQRLDNYLNSAGNDAPQNNTVTNISSMSYIDWDVPVNIPFKANWSINNGTQVAYGECVWAYLATTTTVSQTLDWNNLG